MKIPRCASGLAAVCMLVLASACDEDTPTQPQTGIISVQVRDISSNQPVPDVEIMIVGTSQVARTDATGTAVFEVGVGDYFVDASICCLGPGFIEHHVAVTVLAGETTEVTLQACIACV